MNYHWCSQARGDNLDGKNVGDDEKLKRYKSLRLEGLLGICSESRGLLDV